MAKVELKQAPKEFVPVQIVITLESAKELDKFDAVMASAADGDGSDNITMNDTFRRIAEQVCFRIRGQ